MRNRLRVLAFDVAAPLAAIAALVYIGLALGWPLWWVSLCSVLCLLIVQGVIVNVVLARRDGVTLGTNDALRLRLAVAGQTHRQRGDGTAGGAEQDRRTLARRQRRAVALALSAGPALLRGALRGELREPVREPLHA
ncbi:putative transmembrane protein [Mycolicibacterium conceptionense]|uniref:Putative transmembrane protein n=1 Tax=Mycolicibacterium conceptionense TaxID=451644 RepID=A0A0U1DG33_9MYCO|nr:putative transmembrane protein [Mycolicibacterium conceptionense]